MNIDLFQFLLWLLLKKTYNIMKYGFVNGTFTGKKLTDYIDGDKLDYFNARRIITEQTRQVQFRTNTEN